MSYKNVLNKNDMWQLASNLHLNKKLHYIVALKYDDISFLVWKI